MGLTYHGTLAIDDNDKPVMGGTSSVDNATIINSAYDPTTRRLLVDVSGGGGGSTFVNNEIVSGSGTSWTLAQTPIVGTEHIYGNGQRLTPGAGNDYTISGTAVTTTNSFSAGQILADYQLT